MKYLFDDWNVLSERLRQGRLFLFLDYDGTLTPIAARPEAAAIPKKTKEILRALSGSGQCRVAIISGRALNDVKRLVGLGGLIYVGNHGLEIYDSKHYIRWAMPRRFKKALTEIKKRLEKDFAGIKGVFVEDKKLTLSLHYRAARTDRAAIRRIFANIVKSCKTKGAVAVMAGKKIFEVRPVKEGRKGKVAANLFLKELLGAGNRGIVPIYIGDDETDEDAFEEMGDKNGITIRVGKGTGSSSARYYVNDTDEVRELLEKILAIKKDSSYAGTEKG